MTSVTIAEITKRLDSGDDAPVTYKIQSMYGQKPIAAVIIPKMTASIAPYPVKTLTADAAVADRDSQVWSISNTGYDCEADLTHCAVGSGAHHNRWQNVL